MVFYSAFAFSQVMSHEAGKHRHHHFIFHLHQVIRQGVDSSADLTGQGDCIPWREKKERKQITQWKGREKKPKRDEKEFLSLLGIVEFLIILQHPLFSSLHHVPLHHARGDGVNQVNHRQTGADQLVLQRT